MMMTKPQLKRMQSRKERRRLRKRRRVQRRLIEEGTVQEFKRCVIAYLKSRVAMNYRDLWILGQGYKDYQTFRRPFNLRKDESICSGTLSYLLV